MPAPWEKYQQSAQTQDGYPARQNADGSYSTEMSITVTDPRLNGGRPTNIPSLWKGREVPQEQAITNALATRKPYAAFNSIDEAVQAAKARSAAGGAAAGPWQKYSAPPPEAPPPPAAPVVPPAPQTQPSPLQRAGRALLGLPGVGMAQSAAEGIWNSLAKVPAGFAGIAGTVLPGEPGQGARWTENVREALSVNPSDTSGDPLVYAAGKAVEPWANLLDRGIEKLPATGQDIARGGLEAVGDIANVVGTGAGVAAARTPTTAARGALRDSTKLLGARTPEEVASAAGFQVRPSDIQAAGGPTTRMQRVTEKVGGGPALRRDAILNQLDRTEALTREEFGLPASAKLDEQALRAVEAPHAAAYDAIERIPQIGFDEPFTRQVASIGSDNPLTATAPAIRALQEEILANQGASGLNLRKKISDLRQQARDNLTTGQGEKVAPRDRTLGNAQLKMANSLEDLLERNVAPEQLAAYREARKVFAQTNMIRRANALGNRVDPTVIRDEARVNPSISGRFKIIADSAKNYPNVFSGKVPETTTGQSAGMLARMGSGAAAGAMGGGALFGLPGAVGGAVGGAAIPAAARKLLGPGKAAADIESGAPLYFREPEAATKRPPPPTRLLPAPPPRGPMEGGGPGGPAPALPGEFEDLGYTPDVRAAGAGHPGAAAERAALTGPRVNSPLKAVDGETWEKVRIPAEAAPEPVPFGPNARPARDVDPNLVADMWNNPAERPFSPLDEFEAGGMSPAPLGMPEPPRGINEAQLGYSDMRGVPMRETPPVIGPKRVRKPRDASVSDILSEVEGAAPATQGRSTGGWSDLLDELQQEPPAPPRQPQFGPGDEFPGGAAPAAPVMPQGPAPSGAGDATGPLAFERTLAGAAEDDVVGISNLLRGMDAQRGVLGNEPELAPPVYRGVPFGQDPNKAINPAGATHWTPDVSEASDYGPTVGSTVPVNPADLGTITDLLASVGMDPATAGQPGVLLEALRRYKAQPGAAEWARFSYPIEGNPTEYVHFPPQSAAPTANTGAAVALLKRYDAQDGANNPWMSEPELLDELDSIADQLPPQAQKLLDDYRDIRADDAAEHGLRGDSDDVAEQTITAIRRLLGR
jgi:hypothetical protein